MYLATLFFAAMRAAAALLCCAGAVSAAPSADDSLMQLQLFGEHGEPDALCASSSLRRARSKSARGPNLCCGPLPKPQSERAAHTAAVAGRS